MVLRSPVAPLGPRPDGAIAGVAYVNGGSATLPGSVAGGEHTVADREFPSEGANASASPRAERLDSHA